jgi:rhodanese-related sulfurtransferase
MKQHSPRFLDLVTAVKAQVKEVTVQELKEKLERKEALHLIDVREQNEHASGQIPGSLYLGKGVIERDIEKYITDSAAPIVVYCSGGFRSVLTADNLQKMGYANVYSLKGGLSAWLEAGNPLVK